MSLEQVLTGAPENTQTETQQTEQVVTDSQAQTETQTEAQVTEKVEQQAATTAAQPDQTVPIKALMAERDKRQALEQRLKSLEQQQPQPSFWEKPEEHLQRIQTFVQQQAIVTKMDLSESIAREKHADFDEKLGVFSELVQANPTLLQQAAMQRNPAEWVYSVAKNHMELKQAGSIEGMRSKLEAEIRAKVEAEFKAKAEAEAKKRESIPQTLTDVQAGTGPKPAEFLGPTPLNTILS